MKLRDVGVGGVWNDLYDLWLVDDGLFIDGNLDDVRVGFRKRCRKYIVG